MISQVTLKEEKLQECAEIKRLLKREKELERIIISRNKESKEAVLLETIPGIGPINASILSIKPMKSYDSSKDFAASLGIVPKQYSTGGKIQLGSISKQGDRYARTMLIQAGRSIVMRTYKKGIFKAEGSLYNFVRRLKKKKKEFNVICVAVANKLARMAHRCIVQGVEYQADKGG